MVKEVWR